jgi:glycosyltransferase involved in cell wall biosynthesis
VDNAAVDNAEIKRLKLFLFYLSTSIMKNSHKKVKTQPFVSICTPTFNRRPFIEIMFECFRNQNYPKDKMEWIIVDDGTDKIEDLIKSADIPQIKYFPLNEKLTLGKKRNFMHEKTKGSIIVYMDDDDYYPPDRVSHAVERLQQNPKALCAGSSELYIYFKHIKKMYQCGPYGPNHATAGTFAFRRELLTQTRYEDNASLAEERAFLKNYTIPFIQLDPMKSILVFSHIHNTFDKRKLLENPHPDYMKESPKTVDHFIKTIYEKDIKDFFMNRIDGLLAAYEPGDPKMKPDVLKRLVEIDEQRKKMMEQQNGDIPQIMMERPGEARRPMTPNEIVDTLRQTQHMNQLLQKRVRDLELMVQGLQKQLLPKQTERKDVIISEDGKRMVSL